MQMSVRSQFGKHVPRILRRQLILQLMQQYLNIDQHNDQDNLSFNECRPSIQRFHGALLFVDISGFTALSLQLSPEDLKFHINEYFTKMLDIVDRYGGDVIKFAGDALFIVWETSQIMKHAEEQTRTSGSDIFQANIAADFNKACKLAVTTAVDCGLEINETCSNHRVSLAPRGLKTENSTSLSGSPPTPSTPTHKSVHINDTGGLFACLNVHAGVTIGLMAGIDIGCNDRWEYFLMGEPLTKVAMAEAQASTGEIVICPEAHAILHPSMARPTFKRAMAKLRICNALGMKLANKQNTTLGSTFEELQELKKHKEDFDTSAVTLPCTCLRGTNGYCKVKRHHTPTNIKMKRNKIRTKIDEGVAFDDSTHEIESVFDRFIGDRLHELGSTKSIEEDFLRVILNEVSLNVKIRNDVLGVIEAAKHVKQLSDRMKAEFVKWAHSCLIDDIARHVHDVVRSNYRFEDTSRIDVCRTELTKQLVSLNAPDSVLLAKSKFYETVVKSRARKLEKTCTILDGTKKLLKKTLTYSHLFSGGHHHHLVTTKDVKNLLDQESAGFSAEIRSVTVMFVKIGMPHMDLLIERHNFGEHLGQFGFLSTTINESLADVLLLHKLQSCFEALTDAFLSHGGQLRQFIVDDKGTVCIGTFGLRGAVSDDNAASALETAQMIVTKLEGLGLSSSIGVTMGKAFCGLVGSQNRHEYAVMGPSTNLSARLMCKAPPGGIICDLEIRNHDRTHQFITLADIVAKGYQKPVGTFQPIFKDEVEAANWHKLKLSRQYSHIIAFDSSDSNPPPVTEGGSVLEGKVEIKPEGRRQSSVFNENVPSIVRKMLRGPYCGVSGDTEGTTRRELVGRKEEVRNILKFLFCDLVDELDSREVFRTDKHAFFAGVVGCKGIGKSSVVNAVVHQVNEAVLMNRSCKVHTFKTRLCGFNASVPFHAWKSLIKEMLIRLYNISRIKEGGSTKSKTLKVSMSVDVVSCVNYMMSLLPEHYRKFEPLLGYWSILPEEREALEALGLNSQEIIQKSMELFFEIIRVYVNTTKSVVFIVAEDLHLFDLASQMLLKHIWDHGKGIIVLFSTQHALQQIIKPTTPTNTAVLAVAVHHHYTDLIQGDFATSLFNHERYLGVELGILSRDQINAIVRGTLTDCGISGSSNLVFDKIFEESGGNPMYACELAKSVANMHHEQIDVAHICSVKMPNCHRIEEIIYHRFDQLSNSAQLLLKIAAAICSNGASFTYEMLIFVMVDNTRDAEIEQQVVKDLMDVVNTESFLYASNFYSAGDIRESHDNSINADCISKNQYTFHFSVSLEKATIYELLLVDQKQLIHERIAEYFQEKRKFDVHDTDHLEEETFHWQRASNWIHAMACSYKSSLVETNEHKKSRHVETAYRMYQAVRKQQDLSAKSDIEHHWPLESLETLFELALTDNEEIYDAPALYKFTIEDISQLYCCDSELLRIGMQLEVLMARKQLKNYDYMKENQFNIEEALQILLLTKNGHILNNNRVTQLMKALQQKTLDDVTDHDDVSKEDDVATQYFTVGSEFQTICRKLLSVYVENYLQLVDDTQLQDMSRKVQFAMDEIDAMAMNSEDVYHRIHSWALDVKLNCKDGNFKQAITLGNKIMELYQQEKHSLDLISFYGRDNVPSALAMISQYLLLSSEWKTPLRFLQYSSQRIQSMTHVETINSAIYYVVNNLVFLKRFGEALMVFKHYLHCVAHEHEERSMIDGIYLEWLSRLIRFDLYSQNGDIKVFEDDAVILDEVILGGGMNQLLDIHQFDNLSVQGRGIDAVLADVCAMKIVSLWNDVDRSEDLQLYCKALKDNVNTTLSMTCGRPHELMFNKTCTMLVVGNILQRLTGLKRQQQNADCALVEVDHSENNSIDSEGKEVEHSAVQLEILKDLCFVVSDINIQQITNDSHHLYSIFALLVVRLLRKLKHESLLAAASAATNVNVCSANDGSNSPALEQNNYNKELWNCLRQLMLNGSCELKIFVLKDYKMLGLAATWGSYGSGVVK